MSRRINLEDDELSMYCSLLYNIFFYQQCSFIKSITSEYHGWVGCNVLILNCEIYCVIKYASYNKCIAS